MACSNRESLSKDLIIFAMFGKKYRDAGPTDVVLGSLFCR